MKVFEMGLKPPADDGGGDWEPPPHTDQTHPEPDGRRTEEVLVRGAELLEEDEHHQSGQPHGEE